MSSSDSSRSTSLMISCSLIQTWSQKTLISKLNARLTSSTRITHRWESASGSWSSILIATRVKTLADFLTRSALSASLRKSLSLNKSWQLTTRLEVALCLSSCQKLLRCHHALIKLLSWPLSHSRARKPCRMESFLMSSVPKSKLRLMTSLWMTRAQHSLSTSLKLMERTWSSRSLSI